MDKWLREYQTRGYRIKIAELLEQSKQTRLVLNVLRGALHEVTRASTAGTRSDQSIDTTGQ